VIYASVHGSVPLPASESELAERKPVSVQPGWVTFLPGGIRFNRLAGRLVRFLRLRLVPGRRLTLV